MKAQRVFISYSRKDQEFARRLAEDLQQAGADVWIDFSDITPGREWDREITAALDSCAVVVAILSPHAVDSPTVNDEIAYALERDKEVIPLILRPCNVSLRLVRLQHLDLVGGYEQLLARLLDRLSLDAPLRPSQRRLWLATCGAVLLGMAPSIAAGAIFHQASAVEAPGACEFKGEAQSIEIAGRGDAALTRSDAFTGNDVSRVELWHFKLAWNEETSEGGVQRTSGEHLAFARPENLLPIARAEDTYEARYRFGDPIRIEVEAGGNPGHVQGAEQPETGDIKYNPQQMYELVGQGPRVIVLKRTTAREVPFAGPFMGVQRLVLNGASGTLDCKSQELKDATLSWQSGVGALERIFLTPTGLAISVRANRMPGLRYPRTIWFWGFCALTAGLGAVIALKILRHRRKEAKARSPRLAPWLLTVLALVGCRTWHGSKEPLLFPLNARSTKGVVHGQLPTNTVIDTPPSHSSWVRCVAISPDGRFLASGALDQLLIVWDIATGRPLSGFSHERGVTACAFLDDHRIVSATGLGQISVRDVFDDGPAQTFLAFHDLTEITALAGRADGKEVLIGDIGGRFTAWSTDDAPRPVGTFSKFPTAVTSVAYDSLGRPFASSAGLVAAPTIGAVTVPVDTTIAVPAAGGRLIVARKNGTLSQLDQHGRLWWRFHSTLEGAGRLVAGRDANWIALVNGSGTVEAISTSSGKVICSRTFPDYHLVSLAAHPERPLLALGTTGGDVLIMEVGKCELARFSTGSPAVLRSTRVGVAEIAAGSSVGIADMQGRLTFWDQRTWRQTASIRPLRAPATALAFLGGERWAVGSEDGRIVIVEGDRQLAASWWKGAIKELAAHPEQSSSEVVIVLGKKALRWDYVAKQYKTTYHRDLSIAGFSHDGVLLGYRRQRSREHSADMVYRADTDDLLYSEQAASSHYEDPTKLTFDWAGKHVITGYNDGMIFGNFHIYSGLTGRITALVATERGLWAGTRKGELARWAWDEGQPNHVRHLPWGVDALASTSDGRYLLAGGRRGSVAVIDAKSLAGVGELIVLADGDWAFVAASGEFIASERAASIISAVSVSDRSRSWTLLEVAQPTQRPLLVISEPSVKRLSGEIVQVKTTITSPSGAPQVTIDGVRLDISSPLRGSLGSYRLTFQVSDRSGGAYELVAKDPSGGSKRLTLWVPPDPAASRLTKRYRVLAIGNERYAVNPLQGATKDALDIAEAFAKPDAWQTQVQDAVQVNLTGAQLSQAAAKFLGDAAPGDTLLLYFAGHGVTLKNDFALLGTDESNPRMPVRPLLASTLADWMRDSKAAHVILVLDACRTGLSEGGADVLRELGDKFTTRAIVTSTRPGQSARGDAAGGHFTRAFVSALTNNESAREVTLAYAVKRAALEVDGQEPQRYGGLGMLALVWQSRRAVATTVELTPARTAASDKIRVSASVIEYRQVLLRSASTSGRKLQLRVNLDELANSLHVVVAPLRPANVHPLPPSVHLRRFRPPPRRAHGETCQASIWYEPSDKTRPWPAGAEKTVEIDLEECGLWPGEYQVKVGSIRDGQPQNIATLNFPYPP